MKICHYCGKDTQKSNYSVSDSCSSCSSDMRCCNNCERMQSFGSDTFCSKLKINLYQGDRTTDCEFFSFRDTDDNTEFIPQAQLAREQFRKLFKS